MRLQAPLLAVRSYILNQESHHRRTVFADELEVEFEGGAVYDYFDVPPKVYKDLLRAPSKGRFVSRRIRDRYPFVKREH